jgi:hypothetical protein
MTDSFDKNGPSVSDSVEQSREFRRNPSPDKKGGQKSLAVIQDLSWGSFLPLLSLYLKQGPVLIYYRNASRGGLKLGALLYFLKITVSAPLKINDFHYIDTPHVNYWNTQHQAAKTCRGQIGPIEALIQAHLPKCTIYMRKILATNVCQAWQTWLLENLLLNTVAKQLGKQEGVPIQRVVLISRYASLLRLLNLASSTDSDVPVLPQPNQNRAVLYPLAIVGLSILEVFQIFFRSFLSRTTAVSNPLNPFKVGVAATWGTEGMDNNQKDDLYWWRSSSVTANRLIYMFERKNIQPTQDRVEQAKYLGIESVALNPKYPGDYPNLQIKNQQGQSLLMSFRNFCFVLKLSWKTLLADEFTKAVLALVGWQYYSGRKLSDIYKKLNLKGVFHFEEAGMDIISLASAMNDSVRIGTHWSSHTGINQTSSRSHQVYFLWGSHDAKFALDSGSMARTLLIAGCFLSDHSNEKERQYAQEAVKEMRKRGVRYILTLFDNSPPCPEFYRFFLQWLVEDPCMGLLIKCKGMSWKQVQDDGLNGLVERAKNSNRIYEMNPSASPADAAMLSDFTVGITSISALVVAALKGARILYLDYERVDQGPQEPYCIFHSLGSNRCIFYDPDLLRKAIVNYFENPESNPSLGDATPILDQLDPFRDGKASQRIGEFVEWYLEELDGGLNADDAVRSATDRYAKKWGQNKIIRKL